MMLDHHSLELLKASLGAWDYLFHIVRALINVHNFEIKIIMGTALSMYVIRLAESSISKFCSIYRLHT